ncbi:serine hydrolase [Clostridium sp.]|uniref:serine hydrolase n=1 Tax=Clostridium sp. TaxID=1506 RepID=UPI002FC9D9B0
MNINNKIIENLDKVIKEFMDNEPIPGLTVGVVYNKEVIYTKGFGVKNVETRESVTENSLFHMASVSKTFVATGIMQLVQQGKINLDSRLVEYLPYFQLNDERYKKITIRQLLNHISGMPDVEDYEWNNPQYDEGALERYIRSIKVETLMWEPGEKFAYSNIAFEILGDVIAKVSGVSFEEYMKKNILDILDMKESNFYKPLLSKELLTTPHILGIEGGYGPKVSEVFPYNRFHGPSSTLCSNVVEMCNYAIANLNHGTLGNKQILESDSYLELWTAQGNTGWEGYATEIGLSWFLGGYKGNKVRSHSGGDTGYASNLMLFPEINAALVVMTNADFISLNNLCSAIMDIIIGVEPEKFKKSLARHIARTLISSGYDAALESYSFMKEKDKESYIAIEREFNSTAYGFLCEKAIEKAIEILKIGLLEFPKASNLYDSLGEMYLINENKKLALENYKKSIELDPNNTRGKKIVEELEGELK